MKKFIAFFKANSSLITNFWINQVVWSVVGLMISWPLSIIFNESPNYGIYMGIAALFSAGIFWFRIYDILNQYGLKFSLRKAKKSDEELGVPSDTFGLKIGAIAYIPTAILVLLFVIFSIIEFNSGTVVTVSALYMLPVHSMYNAGWLALSELNVIWRIIYTVLALFPAPLLAWLGFYLGVRDKGVIAREKSSKE